ncbi:hypothetical protein IT575_08720 [bacterium]|nr:hypothetical protein [bacterium]
MRSIPLLAALGAGLVIASSSATAYSPAGLGPQGELFERALAQAGLTPADARFDLHDRAYFGGDKYRLPFFDGLTEDPWKLSPHVRKLSAMLVEKAGDPATVLISAQSRISAGVRLGLTGDVLEKYSQRVTELGADNLAVALSEYEGVPVEAYRNLQGYDSLPPAIRDNAALLLFVLPDVQEYRTRGLTQPMLDLGLNPLEVQTKVLEAARAEEEDDDLGNQLDTTLLIEKLLDHTDQHLLNTGATLLAIAAQRVRDNLAAEQATLQTAQWGYSADTTFGRIELSSNSTEASVDVPLVLAIHGYGDDNFLMTPAAKRGLGEAYNNAASVIIDLGGNDNYASTDDAIHGFGAGVFGYGYVYDLGGDDSYKSGFIGQGSGIFGTGLLYDASGNDSYTSVASSQGSGQYGSGLLIDLAGNDTYNCFQTSQGYGYTRGIGLLLDASGDDRYIANDSDIRFPGPQTAEHNTSMSQGVGNGRRGDYLDGHSWAGGVGMLIDGAGSDSYSCGVFGQACSYWYGTGILCDKGPGSDSFSGIWYVQGSGAHFGLACLQNEEGDDRYLATMNMAQGAGHDFSLSWFEDASGNDSYSAPNLSLGGANANGLGFFWDAAGNDTYRSKGVTLGCGGGVAAPSLRQFMLNLGVFVDGGGSDIYEEELPPPAADATGSAQNQSGTAITPPGAGPTYRPWDFAGNGRAWSRPGTSIDTDGKPVCSLEWGVGIDAP